MKIYLNLLIPISLLILLSTISDYGIKNNRSNTDELKINQIQVLGTHNSYAMGVDKRVLNYASKIIDTMMPKMMETMPSDQLAQYKENHPNEVAFSEALNYQHPPFPQQLNAGLRSLEIDVYHDPEGRRFLNPASYTYFQDQGIKDLASFKKEGLESPGFKVLHMADLDFRSHYATLKDALQELKQWSDENPDHIPIFIQMEAKGSNYPLFPNPTPVLEFDKNAFDALDEEVVSVLGKEKIITPDDVRGNFATLKEAVLNHNWPMLSESRGKFLFLLLPSTGGLDTSSPYTEDHPNLEGRIMFPKSSPEDSYAAFLLMDNAIMRQNEIQEYVKKGYLVRTRADIETYEAKVNDYTRAEAAFASGAQVVSTDFYQPGNNYDTDYFVKLPGEKEYRINPVNVSGAQ